jgi:hypothetical protein
MAVDFSRESYDSIGGFTQEHLAQVLLKIKQENTTLSRKDLMPF